MKELYGILGCADAPEEIIHGALDDIRTTVNYLVPWYGIKPIPSALIAVYDWMLDNEASYEVISIDNGAPCPKALREGATKVEMVQNPSQEIIERLSGVDPSGIALLMWDAEDPEESMSMAITCIREDIPLLELTAGLSPIILDDDDEVEIGVEFDQPHIDISSLPPIDPMEWDEETLDVMPAASVKKMARDAGHDVKTKAEAIKAIKGTPSKEKTEEPLGRVIIQWADGSEMSVSTNQKLLKEILDMVVKSQTSL